MASTQHWSAAGRAATIDPPDQTWRQLFEDSPAISLLFDPDGGRILAATRAALAFYGYDRDALLDLRLSDIDTLPPAAIQERMTAAAASDGTSYFRCSHRLRSGAIRIVDVYAGPVRFGGREVVQAVVHDVSDQAEAQRDRDRLATAVEQAAESVVITDADANIVYVNPAFERVTGYTRAEALGQNPRLLKSGVQSPTFYDAMWAAISNGLPWVADMANRRKDGTLYQEEAVITPIRDPDGAITGYVAVKRDVTRERALEAEGVASQRERAFILETLRHLPQGMSTDASGQAVCQQVVSMTGLTHAHLFLFGEDGAAQPIGLATADGRSAPAQTLPQGRSHELRERAAVGPWIEDWITRRTHPYNDLLDGLGVRAAAYVPVRAGATLMGILIVGAQTAGATGILSAALPGLIDFADVAAALLAPTMTARQVSSEARRRIATIIAEGSFDPVFQPIVDMRTSRTVGYEALTRFRDGTAPNLVFAEAHRLGLEHDLEIATLRAAIKAAAGLPVEGFLSLNTSPTLITAEPRLPTLLRSVDRPIVLEITEHEQIADYAALRCALLELGGDLRLAVDDAGAGVANFQHLVNLRPQFIKVDAELVRGVDEDPARQALIVALLHFAASTGCRVIAEGIETEAEAGALRGLGVELGQGFVLARPAPVSVLTEGTR